jgi:hypothetical protein
MHPNLQVENEETIEALSARTKALLDGIQQRFLFARRIRAIGPLNIAFSCRKQSVAPAQWGRSAQSRILVVFPLFLFVFLAGVAPCQLGRLFSDRCEHAHSAGLFSKIIVFSRVYVPAMTTRFLA